jgi:hypothetical protein
MRFILFFLLFLPSTAIGQTDYDMDELARNAPDSKKITVEALAQYFVKNIREERGRVRAIFAWITLNIRYLDTSNASEIWATPEHLDRQRPEQVLKNRTAVCQGFANLFQALAKSAGMESQVVTGIVKNEAGEVMRVGHAWVAVKVLGEWRLFDPTWCVPPPGASWGVNDAYFMVPPEKFVLNHLPDDPAWQLLENPVHETDFREKDDAELSQLLQEAPDQIFDFRDTLKTWVSLDSVARTFAAESRTLAFNGSNQRVLFGLGQSYWGAFFDLRMHLDSLATRSILQNSIPIDTLYFSAQLNLMYQYQRRAQALFSQVTDPRRTAYTEKFYSSSDVIAIVEQLRGSMWTAVFENHLVRTQQEISDATLQQLKDLSEAADEAYLHAQQAVDCTRFGNTCYGIWHNLSLLHLQLAERHSLFSQNLLNEKQANKYLKTIDLSVGHARKLFERAEAETRQLLLIPPPYAFVRDRLQSIRQGLFSLKVTETRARRVALSKQVESALAPTNRSANTAKAVTVQLQPIVEDLAELSQIIEDAYSELGAEYCDVTLFNLHQEGFAMQFNLGSLYFRAALDMHQNALENNTLAAEKKRIQTHAQKAFPWLREAKQSLEFLDNSKRVPNAYNAQKTLQINQLTKSINAFLDSLL